MSYFNRFFGGNSTAYFGTPLVTDLTVTTANALDKFRRKKLDMIVANDVSQPEIGFGSDDNRATINRGENNIEELEKMSKFQLADALLDRVLEMKPF